MDGNYNGTMNLRLAAADTIVFVDLPRWLCLWRVIKRRVMFHGRGRPDTSEGCTARLTWGLLRWIGAYPPFRKPKNLQMLAEQSENKRVIHLKGKREVERFLFAVQAISGRWRKPCRSWRKPASDAMKIGVIVPHLRGGGAAQCAVDLTNGRRARPQSDRGVPRAHGLPR